MVYMSSDYSNFNLNSIGEWPGNTDVQSFLESTCWGNENHEHILGHLLYKIDGYLVDSFLRQNEITAIV